MFSILFLNCSKEVEKQVDFESNKVDLLETSRILNNPLEFDSSFKEIVRLTLFENELSLALNNGRISKIEFNEILSKLAIPEQSWIPNFGQLNNFNQVEFFNYLDQNYSHTNLSTYFTQLLFQIESFYHTNKEYLSELSDDEKNAIFVDALRKVSGSIEGNILKVGIRTAECDWCKREYDICISNAWINGGSVFAAGYTTAASMAIYSGGVFTAGAGFTLLGGTLGGAFTVGAGYWTCANTRNACYAKHNCSGSGEGYDKNGDDDHHIEKDYIIIINIPGRN